MKKIYENIKIAIILMFATDIVTLSINQKDDVADDIFAPNN